MIEPMIITKLEWVAMTLFSLLLIGIGIFIIRRGGKKYYGIGAMPNIIFNFGYIVATIGEIILLLAILAIM